MQIRFWGVRGSIASPGPETVKYGGNTACLELRIGKNGRLMIIDAGSGIRPLGAHLRQNNALAKSRATDIFLTHTHWDHIMGFPFFDPIYIPGTRLTIYGPTTYEDATLDQVVGDQLRYRYFPVRHSELSAQIEYHQLKEESLDLGDGISVHTKYLNHNLLCLGYRFEHEGKVFCTGYDTEPFRNVFRMDPSLPGYDPLAEEEGERVAQEENDRIRRFFRKADILVHDAQYTQKEYDNGKTGWGHSTFEHAIETALAAQVKTLVMFHHDPARTDAELERLEAHYQASLAGNSDMNLVVARENMVLEL